MSEARPIPVAAPSQGAERRGLWPVLPAVILLLVVLAVLPVTLLESYRLFQLTLAVIYAIAILGLNIVTGYNGQISLGHGAFYAIIALSIIMFMQSFVKIPEVVTGLGGATLIGISLWSSIRWNRKNPDAAAHH